MFACHSFAVSKDFRCGSCDNLQSDVPQMSSDTHSLPSSRIKRIFTITHHLRLKIYYHYH